MLALATLTCLGTSMAQEPEDFKPVQLIHTDLPDLSNKNVVYNDTVDYHRGDSVTVVREEIQDPYRVVTNKFGKNWFIFATGGAHSFRGDYSSDGGFWGTVSPDWSVGIGKWFTPGVALKVEFIRSNSRGYTEYITGHYGYGDILQKSDGTPYRKFKTGWWDISGAVVLNFTRLFCGFEGIDSKRHMNQFMGAFGIGGVHHLGYEHSHGSDNEWSGHVEFQYSRFFTKAKRISLDLKVRGIFYQTNFDLEYGQGNYAAQKWDYNLGVDIGFTWYLGKKRSRGWDHSRLKQYQTAYNQRDVVAIYKEDAKPVEYNTMTFYVFYPNNYSGRNDFPVVENSSVNAIDYLVGGLFTQMKYANTSDARERLELGISPIGLNFVNIPTEQCNQELVNNFVPRGYEMQSEPMVYSLAPQKMLEFEDKAGFIYAPIYDGAHTWCYRIDKETYGQTLLSDANYKESRSYQLNAHQGLGTVRQNMNIDDNEFLVSLADVYAAMTSNEGYIANYTDVNTVEKIEAILKSGIITLIQCEGLATSQDNYSGANAAQVGIERNTALSQNRANTVIGWLKQNPKLNDVSSQIFLVNTMLNGIAPVSDTSTQTLDPKLNRSVKVKIHYILP